MIGHDAVHLIRFGKKHGAVGPGNVEGHVYRRLKGVGLNGHPAAPGDVAGCAERNAAGPVERVPGRAVVSGFNDHGQRPAAQIAPRVARADESGDVGSLEKKPGIVDDNAEIPGKVRQVVDPQGEAAGKRTRQVRGRGKSHLADGFVDRSGKGAGFKRNRPFQGHPRNTRYPHIALNLERHAVMRCQQGARAVYNRYGGRADALRKVDVGKPHPQTGVGMRKGEVAID